QKVKGIGPWTAEMFLMFAMGREDVFSHGDYGLRKSVKQLYKFKKEPTKKQIETIVKKWAPYRTYGCLILWEILDTN
ncbi:DNA-3-methyladenine glycosylase 2 family protein, partial [Candidatus Roizmanbacteria bacterium]|nr:DNA-3-methyladenine glycosylase 2 family protein [Candidatus Roizmanbacteria bacterium]